MIMKKITVYNGIDRAENAKDILSGARIALLTSASGITKKGVPAAETLSDFGKVTVLLAPEHGIRSNLQDGLYGKDLDGKDKDGNIRPYHLGHFFIAIDTNHFLGEDLCRKKAGDIIRSVRASKKQPGQDHIYSAGEKEWLVWQERKDSGVPINESVQAEFCKVRDDLKLDYKFPWE